MTREEFLSEMQEVLQRDEPVTWDMELENIDEWDSLALMGTAAFVSHKFSRRLSMEDFKSMRTIADIASAAGLEA